MPAESTPSQPILQAFDENRAAILIDGRDLRDLDVYPNTNTMGPLLEILCTELKHQGIALIIYSLSKGIDYESTIDENVHNRQIIETLLRNHNLLDIPQDEREVAQIIKGVTDLCRSNSNGLQWSDGTKMRLCVLMEFSDHLLPCSQGVSPTDAQLVAIESAVVLGKSLALRSSGNFVILHTEDAALLAPSVRAAFHHIHLPQPSQAPKKKFVQEVLDFYDVKLEPEQTADTIAFITSNTPNRGLEELCRAAHRSGRILTAKELIAQKSAAVELLSGQTLTVLDTSRTAADNQLEGRNSKYPWAVLSGLSKSLAKGDPNMPANVLLVGPPGTGKTEMCMGVGKQANVSVYQLHNPKGSLVGETERLVARQHQILREAIPNIAFVDEITEVLPLERNDFDGDSGASRAVAAAMLTALADESRRGQSLLIGTTNCAWRMGAAMRSRFVMIPVLNPLEMDYAAIVVAIARRVGSATADVTDLHPAIIQAAAIFYRLGANPRHIRAALSNALLLKGEISPTTILFAAEDCTVSSDRASAIYSDLWAVATCSAKSFFPWCNNLDTYPFPEHLKGLVDPRSGDINRDLLDSRIQEYKPHANV
jgi:hypothetical protein